MHSDEIKARAFDKLIIGDVGIDFIYANWDDLRNIPNDNEKLVAIIRAACNSALDYILEEITY